MIGIIDWGIGGLSVYRAIREQGSTADVLYFSDSGFTPYGKLSRERLRARLVRIAEYFQDKRVSPVLVACHAASSALEPKPESGVEKFGSADFYSIIPAACRTVARSPARRVGIIGGEVTIRSGVYETALAGLNRHLQFQIAQPLSGFVEAGELDTPAVESEIKRLLARFGEPDALLLACTHYPALASIFHRLAPGLELLDPGAEMAAAVREQGSARLQFITTGNRENSVCSAALAFGIALDSQMILPDILALPKELTL